VGEGFIKLGKMITEENENLLLELKYCRKVFKILYLNFIQNCRKIQELLYKAYYAIQNDEFPHIAYKYVYVSSNGDIADRKIIGKTF
jgi:hypothetical protein